MTKLTVLKLKCIVCIPRRKLRLKFVTDLLKTKNSSKFTPYQHIVIQ